MSDAKNKLSFQSNVLIVGTGGQGVITAAELLTNFFLHVGDEALSGQVHGMAQRGGAVQSSIMVNRGISPVMRHGDADIVLGFEPLEVLRAVPFISEKTFVLMNTRPVMPYVLSQQYVRGNHEVAYPPQAQIESTLKQLTEKVFSLDATQLALDAGSMKTLNVVMLGCLLGSQWLPYAAEVFQDAVMSKIPPRLAKSNDLAFRSGLDWMTNILAAK